ncbi:MAG: tRNA lysidine(34) synthetase TilS [Hyphomicrobiales bacterium]|nr:tRNA lysidine(34) synthetase TilS [Hyphomicrobiales bacterium]OQW83043.1 MAG: tRNA lysidine(34) synthetase TilS [Proteobacteria bacterium ST_bin15]
MQAADYPPFAADELDRLFASFSDLERILIAVSGGSDSMALLDLMVRWRAALAAGPALVAATVDHRLRAASRQESLAAARFCTTLGVPHRILAWQGDKPGQGLPAAAREARYDLLRREGTRIGAALVVTAHTLDDQAETVLMRLARGSGLRGLAAMRACVEIKGLRITRPLLAVRRERLRAHLSRHGIAWQDDPTNHDENYLRPRLRRLMPLLAAEGLTAERLAEIARKLGRADEAIKHYARALERLHDSAGRLERIAYRAAPQEVRLRYLAARISLTGGEPLPPPERQLTALDEQLCDEMAVKVRRTLGFSIISAGRRYLRITVEKKSERR